VIVINDAQRRQDYGHPTYAVYVDLRATFDSLSRSSLWLQLTRIGIPDKTELCQLCSCIPIWECFVRDWNWCLPWVYFGTRLFCHGRGLVAGKNCWYRQERGVIWSALVFTYWFCRWCHCICRVTWTPRTCTWDDGIRSHISRARAELAEDKSPSFGQQGGCAINNHSSRAWGCSRWRVCLSWIPYPLNNWKLTCYLKTHV